MSLTISSSPYNRVVRFRRQIFSAKPNYYENLNQELGSSEHLCSPDVLRNFW